MNIHESGILCTKRKLWKKKTIIESLVIYFEQIDYQFVDLVIGEPNNFVFADEVHEIPQLLKRKGFFGIRIKFKNDETQIEIHSNTNGVNNVTYEIYSKNEETLKVAQHTLEEISSIIGSTNQAIVKSTEFISRQRKIRNAIVIIVVLILMYFLNIHILLLGFVSLLYSFLPFLFFYLIISRLFRR